ncbi:hypothetical protein IKF21_01415 [Candidatus Saccharibacteria bacterium]|nr:hypothetical protein [Candidatus Saccharibacteria bacterium]
MKKIISGLIILLLSVTIVLPVFADCPEGSVPVSILGGDGNIVDGTNGERCLIGTSDGSAIGNILKTILDIMAIGIGILGVLGITIVGIQYLTAGDNEARTHKAKRRMTEIVIGLAVYVVIYGVLSFLLPGSSFDPENIQYSGDASLNTNGTTQSGITTQSTNNKTNKANQAKNAELIAKAKQAERVKKLQDAVKEFAWPKWHDSRSKGATITCWGADGNARTTNYTKTRVSGGYAKYSKYSSRCGERDCGIFVSAVMHYSGWDTKYKNNQTYSQITYLRNSSKWEEIPKSKLKKLGNKALEPGDVVIKNGHVFLFADVKGFESKFVEASFGHHVGMSTASNRRNIKTILDKDSNYHVFRRVKW